ncbi:hypothetical protein ILUMI_08592 [Ignelater luminosus]|uniref:Cytochrome P450 n=1 Tax=Ignelater luminosus TaxID=2038154 RepID=A0A8K0GFA2_IGNLU|nr:hypothetical protein ILUMI_08592 [Ignelater luminosus]
MGPTVFRRKPYFELFQDFYEAFPNKRYNGIHQFLKPVLVVRDLELIKQITVKDFDHFTDHKQLITKDADPLMGRSLSALNGQSWRDMRATLSPFFTSGKIKNMFILLSECAEQFTEHFQKQGSRSTVIKAEMKDVFTRFANDAIASVAFGLQIDSLKERNNRFYLMGKDATTFAGFGILQFLLVSLNPVLMKLFNMTVLSKRVSTFFRHIVKESIQQREDEGLIRPDMIHLLMQARKGQLKYEDEHENNEDEGTAMFDKCPNPNEKVEKRNSLELSLDDITAQALIFLFGGIETSATLTCFIAYELALHFDVQKRLQNEIDETLKECNGKITYDTLLRMKYLDMVVSETLRKWPPGVRLDRLCVKDYIIKPKYPDEKPLLIQKNQIVLIPFVGIHRDPKYFPNPDKFDPERFSECNKDKIKPISYMPFGLGPRSCIASRFALMENKLLIFHLLSRFSFVPVEETLIPVKLGVGTFSLMPDKGFWLGLQPR